MKAILSFYLFKSTSSEFMIRKIEKIVLLLIFTCLTSELIGQVQLNYTNLSIEHGLSQGMIIDMIQDKEGFIWAATMSGLNRYDGYAFKQYTHNPYDSNTLSSNAISSLFEDSKGRIWVGTYDSGVNVLDKKTGKFHRILLKNEKSKIVRNQINRGISEGESGIMYIPLEGEGMYIVDLPNDALLNNKAYIEKLNSNELLIVSAKDSTGQIWLLSNSGTKFLLSKNQCLEKCPPYINFPRSRCIIDGTKWAVEEMFQSYYTKEYYEQKKCKYGFPMEAIEYPKNTLWTIGITRGLYQYDITNHPMDKQLEWSKNIKYQDPNIELYTFIIDNNGILWAGTKGYGIKKINFNSSKFNHISPDFSVVFIVEDGLEIYINKHTSTWKNLSKTTTKLATFLSNDLTDNFIVTKKGNYWISCKEFKNAKSSNFKLYDKNLNLLLDIPCEENFSEKQPMFEDRNGNFWAAGSMGKILFVSNDLKNIEKFQIIASDKSKYNKYSPSNCIYEDSDSNIWIGRDNGLIRLKYTDNHVDKDSYVWYKNIPSDKHSLNYNYVSSVLEDPIDKNLLWISTKGSGLNCLDKNKNIFTHLNTSDGLPNDFIYGLLSDQAGNIWGSTNGGIFCMERQNSMHSQCRIRSFSEADGLQNDEFNTNAYVKLKNGNLAFGGINGLNIFEPKEILAQQYDPSVLITKLFIGNTEIMPNDESKILKNNIQYTKEISLNYRQNVITLEFTSMDFTCPERNKFRYQLEGVDSDWIEGGTRRYTTYLHLRSGEYKFKVQGSNSQGVWSKHSAELHIRILPPWWWSLSAKIAYLSLAVCGIYFAFIFKIRQATLQTQLQYGINEANRIKDINLHKSILYTNITHEFRTPLTIILGMSQLILDNPKSSNNHGIDMIKRNATNLLKLVNDMLDLSKLESGKLELKLITDDIIKYLKYLIEPFQWMAKSQNKQLFLVTNLDSLVITYDSEKISQIINNLVSNAIKFTPERNSIFIHIDEDNEHPNNNMLIIKIRDSGTGISKYQIDRIFERYYHKSEAETNFKGTGIGLALTKELVHLMNGEITVNSPATGFKIGTEFIVKIPIYKIETNSTSLIFSSINTSNINKENENYNLLEHDPEKDLILLIEDNADIIEYLSIYLNKYNVVIAKDGQEGFIMAKEMIPDLIITDVIMPNLDGFEMCRMLKKDSNTNHIPIIIITAKSGKKHNLEALHIGADVFLEKPFQQEELTIQVEKLLSSRMKLQSYYLNKFHTQKVILPLTQNVEPKETNVILDDPFILKVKLLIEQNLSSPDFKVEQLCKLLFMSHSQVHRKLDALIACSPNKVIRMVRMEKAKELLKNSNQSIASIALTCGYGDPAYFSRVFKQEFQETPLEWLEKNLN